MARIVVGMSGGVDSSVAAYLLKQEGHDVIGVFMKNWDEKDDAGVCTSQQDWEDVCAVCEQLSIPYYSVNFAKEYWDRVFVYFLKEYKRGRTPNPDVLCNREIKFSAFLEFAQKLGADKLATGHFARVEQIGDECRLLRSADENKDQTYFLYMLGQRPLSKAVFPLGGLTKPQVRQIARDARLPNSEKKDSTGVCFIGERDFKAFLSGYLPATPGDMVDESGNVVGKHDGLMYYTLGQRRGLGIGGGGDGRRWFVIDKQMEHNRLIVAQGEDSPRLYSMSARADDPHWVSGYAPGVAGEWFECRARFRHRQPLQRVWIKEIGGEVHIRFDTTQRAITPGQAAVFYYDDACLGGATMDAAFTNTGEI